MTTEQVGGHFLFLIKSITAIRKSEGQETDAGKIRKNDK